MKRPLVGLMLLVLLGIVAVGAWWWFDLRWQPKTVTKNQAEIVRILEQSGWVSPRLAGPKLYVVSATSCPSCVTYAREEFQALHEGGVDTRVIMVARPEENGVEKSTAIERATVAELWITRNWPMLERWQATPDTWSGASIPPADGDMARSAVVEVGRVQVGKLEPLLKANGIRFDYPLLVWWTKDGEMKACNCRNKASYRFVRRDLGAG